MKTRFQSRAAFLSAVIVTAAAPMRAPAAGADTGLAARVPSYQQVNPGVTLRVVSPVVYFRSILGMTPAERTNALASKPAEFKKAVLAKVEEYQALPKEIREARLRETQLRWVLETLMNRPPSGRAALLGGLGPADRALLEERLRRWDEMPADKQKAFLENASFLDFYLGWLASSLAERQAALNSLSPSRRQEFTNELARWQTVPETERQRLCDQFHQFFEQSREQQRETLTSFSAADRQAMTAALTHFSVLSPAQRKACIDSFQKFATMDPEERNQFFKNADRWEAMTSDERGLWGALVQKYPIQPPMPQGAESLVFPPLPTLPTGVK
jgi:hypothetical protein